MNAIFFVYLIKTMFGVPSSCKQCWAMSFIYFRPNSESLFILVTVENSLKEQEHLVKTQIYKLLIYLRSNDYHVNWFKRFI